MTSTEAVPKTELPKPPDELIVLDKMLADAYSKGYKHGFEHGVQAALGKAD